MDEIVIKVSASDDGYHFYVYDGHDGYIECDEADGGLCTTTMENAIDMAAEQAKDLLRRRA